MPHVTPGDRPFRTRRGRTAPGLAASALIAVALVGAACDSPTETMRVFTTTYEARELVAPLALTLIDRTGLVVRIAQAQPDGARASVENDAGRNDVLLLSWGAGVCDRSIELDFDRAGDAFRLTSRTDRADTCRLAGILRVLRIELSSDVPAESVTFEEQTAP